MPSSDLRDLDESPSKLNPSDKSSAALEQELAAARKTIVQQKAERLVFIIAFVVIWDAHTFKSYSTWAPTIAILALELLGLFVLAYRFDTHEVVTLFWATIRGYAQRDPGTPPD